MTQTALDILKQALQLPPADRFTVAQELWNSVEPYTDSPVVIDDALMAEIDRRYEELQSGAETPLTHKELMASVREAVEGTRANALTVDDELLSEIRRRDAEIDAGMGISREEMNAKLRIQREQGRVP